MADLSDMLAQLTPPQWDTEVQVPAGYTVSYRSDPRAYAIDGVEVPSVTAVLDILHKPALTWWGMKVGVEGLQTLVECTEDLGLSFDGHVFVNGEGDQATVDEIVDLLKEHKLTVNHVRDSAAKRGVNIHDYLEAWARHGYLPNPLDAPEEERGYVEGLLKFVKEVQPEPIEIELIVGSKEVGFAGRFDLWASTTAKDVQTGPRTQRVIPSGRGLLDLKTSKNVYTTHFLQLAGYRGATEESGYGRSDYEAVVIVRLDGTYDFRVSPARYEHFLAVKTAYDALKRLK